MTGGPLAAPPRRDRQRDRERDGCGPAGVRRPEPPRAAHRHTHTYTHTLTYTHAPARPGILPKFPPPPPRRRVPLGALRPPPESGPGTAQPGPARPGTAAVCPNPQPDTRPGCQPPPTPSLRLQRRLCPAGATAELGQRGLGTAADAVRLGVKSQILIEQNYVLPLAAGDSALTRSSVNTELIAVIGRNDRALSIPRCFTRGHPPASRYCRTYSSFMRVTPLQCVRLLVHSDPQ